MAIQKVSISQFLELSEHYPVVDVRSPGEFLHAHIPGANNIPLFSDEERKTVGTAYKQQSREVAVKMGLEYFGVKMKGMVEEAEKIIDNWQLAISKRQRNIIQPDKSPLLPKAFGTHCLLIHCWRGGMRSAGVAWLLDLYGFKVYTLTGGYKAYRKWVLAQFEKDYPLHIIGGYTGSGKTLLLKELEKSGHAIIDLEGLASHKGSAFGALGEGFQPGQEMFENLLAGKLGDTGNWKLDKCSQYQANLDLNPQPAIRSPQPIIWLEDESQRIGNLQIPMPFWFNMRKSQVYFLDIPFEERLHYLCGEYGKFDKEKLVNAIIRIQKRLGGLETKNAINHLLENNTEACFGILLRYYDKWYGKGLFNRDNISALLNKISCASVDTETNIKKLLSCEVLISS